MLSILPIESKEEQARLCALCDIPYDAESLAYAAWEEGRFLGAAQFRLTAGRCELRDLACARGVDDREALFIMGRGLFYFADRVGFHRAVAPYPERILPALLKQIGFHADPDGVYGMNLAGVFDKHH